MTGKSDTPKGGKRPPDDAALLEHAFADVTPLPGRKIDPNASTPPPTAPAKSRRRAAPATKTPPAASPAPALPELAAGDAPGVDKRTARRLQRGEIKIEGRLDLHGKTQAEAFAALEDFIGAAYRSGKRCVLVITGKGLRPAEGRVGVLREQVPRWLNRPGLREKILSFRTAQPRDGGEGALYVLIKRAR